MAKFGKERFPSRYQNAVGMGARPILHENSKELVSILINNNLLNPGTKVFELGSGPARNLYYMYERQNELNLNASDLFREAALNSMHPAIKDKINFIEGDSEDIINNNIIPDLDIFLVSDHFMHLQYDKANNILKKILSDWSPSYIMLRELKKEFETPEHPRLYHNYNQLLEKYDKIYETSSKQDKNYFIWLLKRK
jgi:hypothetical protein